MEVDRLKVRILSPAYILFVDANIYLSGRTMGKRAAREASGPLQGRGEVAQRLRLIGLLHSGHDVPSDVTPGEVAWMMSDPCQGFTESSYFMEIY